MGTKRLRIAIPPVLGYLGQAYPLSIMAQSNHYLPWFYTNFIHLYYESNLLDAKIQQSTLNFYNYAYKGYDGPINSPWINAAGIDGKIVEGYKGGPIKFITDCIDNRQYVELNVDEFYIPNTYAHGEYEFKHQFMVYGYSMRKQTIYGLGFDKEGKFTELPVTFNDFEKSLMSYKDIEGKLGLYNLWTYNDNANFRFEVRFVRESLREYLESKNLDERISMFINPRKRVYGMAIYEQLLIFLEGWMTGRTSYDIRPIHIMLEHKKCMSSRVKYMIKHKYLSDEFDYIKNFVSIEKMARTGKSMVIKYKLTNDNDIIKRLIELYRQMQLEEYNAIQVVVDSLTERTLP
ncbi:hypothetical protein RQP50_12570 [Paenibacillus sp. chi10]|uniref:Uncharacterized protein n=1 Tax=Paenibacillus suaedae TaxID=3077233 RepID=A0AAJ2JZ89_9BACL|nr:MULTISPECIES: hypothetical protein [unclassified Paenibacillus]MDT8977077.1 hypothetical protein [Paenibacillus sp. chi10]GAV12349.1 hypothetical protein PBN151_2282 [Paenibacillus sp. NAIST15-1]